MTRQTAYQLLTKYIKNPILIKHSLATEATMRAFANYFGEDPDIWGITGLLHDADYELSKGHPEKHGTLLFKKEPNVVPTEIERAIRAHAYEWSNVLPQTRMEWTLACCDELTGFIMKTANFYSTKKVADVKADFLLRKLRQRNVFPGADRKKILMCQTKLGIPVVQFITVTLNAMHAISNILDTKLEVREEPEKK